MEDLLYNVGKEIIATLAAQPILTLAAALAAGLVSYATSRSQPEKTTATGAERTWSFWVDMVYLLVTAIALAGLAVACAAISTQIFGDGIDGEITRASVVAALSAYLILSTLVSYLSQGLLATARRTDQTQELDVTTAGAGSRERVVMSAAWVKLAFFLTGLGYALLAAPEHLAQPLWLGLIILWLIDIFGLIGVVLSE